MSIELPLEVLLVHHGRWTVASVSGDLDMATAPQLEKACEACTEPLALDLSGVRFVDSSGLRGLFELNQSKPTTVLVDPSAVVRRLLSLTAMTSVFEIVDNISSLDP